MSPCGSQCRPPPTAVGPASRRPNGLERSQEALRIFNQLDDVAALAIVLATIADFARHAGDRVDALYLSGGVTKLWDAVGIGQISLFDASIADFVSERNLSRLSDEDLATYRRGRDADRATIVDHALAYRLV